MRAPVVLAALFLMVPAAAQAPPGRVPGGYAGQQSREIKALSAQEQDDLLAGRGMGLARAGELNHHPGPAHVLQLRNQLALTPDQVAIVEDSFRRMEVAAKPLGAELVMRERALDGAFQEGGVTPSRLVAETEAIGLLQGRLRAVHLAAHLEMRSLLSPAQVAAYDRLRGYDGGEAPATPPAAPVHGHHMQKG